MQYVDSSALVKRYIAEVDSDGAARLLLEDQNWVTAAHTEVEVRRTIAIRLGRYQDMLTRARTAFARDWERTAVVQLDSATCRSASEIAESTGARSLDALHLAAAGRAGAPELRLVTFDIRMAETARGLGWTVVP